MTDHGHAPQHEESTKKQELAQHEVQEVLGFLKRYGKVIGAGALAAALAALAFRGVVYYQSTQRIRAEQLLATAQSPEQLEEVVKSFSSTPSAPAALLTLARQRFNRGETALARFQYERFLKEYKKSELRGVAELGLAYCTEAEGNFSVATEQFSRFAADHSDSYLHAVAVLGIARCMDQAGRKDDARIVLEDFMMQNPGSAWAGSVESALNALAASR
jgi:predicted negative regulator of RcsB-dependent stress response